MHTESQQGPIRTCPIVYLLLILPLLAGCSRGGDVAEGVRHTVDPDGVPVVENGSVPLEDTGEIRPIRLEELARIGGTETADEDYMLSAPARYFDFDVTSDGGMGYAERTPAELRVYAPDGTFRWKGGRSGQGPGEWRSVLQIQHIAGEGWYLFTWPYRLVHFGDGGDLVDSRPAEEMAAARSSVYQAMLPSGAYWSVTQQSLDRDPCWAFLHRGDWRELTTAVVDSVIRSRLEQGDAGRAYHIAWPTNVAVGPSGTLWLNHTVPYQIEVYPFAQEGSRWRIRRAFELQPYSDEYRSQAEAQRWATTRGMAIHSRLQEHRPAIRDMVWTDEDGLWVFTSTYIDSPAVQVDVFDSNGVWVRSFAAPEHLSRAKFTGNNFWVPEESPEDIPMFVRYRYRLP